MAEVTAHPAQATQPAAEPSLQRVMGPWLLLLFIVGDILGTGIYALTGQVAKQVGGAVWLPFLVAFVVALHHRLQLPRAGHQISEGRRRRALHAPRLRHPLRHLPRRLRRDVLGHHLGLDRLARLRRQLVARLRPRPRRRHRHHARRPRLHGGGRGGQLPRRRREREDQRRADLRRADGPADHHRHRPVGDRRRHRATSSRVIAVQDRGRRQRRSGR